MSIEIYDESKVWGTILVSPNNIMSVKYNVIALGDSEFNSHFHVRAYEENDIRASLLPRVLAKKELNALFDVKYKGNADLHSNILAYESNFVDGYFEVRPHGSMKGILDIIEPPRITESLTSLQDSTVRSLEENRYINYGSHSTMMVGTNIDNEYLGSYIKFQLNDYPKTLTVLDGKLRIYYTANMDENAIELYSISKDWDEYGVTYANRPLLTELVSNEYTINKEKKYIEFDVSDYVQGVISNELNNYGFGLKANNNKSYSFYTKESSLKPQLTITYFDNRVLSLGRADFKGTLFAYGTGKNDLHGFIKVTQYNQYSNLGATLYTHRYEDPLFNYQYGLLNVSKPELHGTLLAIQSDNSDFRSMLFVRKEIRRNDDGFINVSTPDLLSSMYARYHDNLDAFISIRAYKEEDRVGKLFVSVPELHGTIYTMPTEDLNSYITIQQNDGNNTHGYVHVSRPEIKSEIYVKFRDDLNGFVHVRRSENSDSIGIISASNPELKSTLYTKYRSDLEASITGRAYEESHLTSFIHASVPDLVSTLLVKELDSLDSFIKIRQSDKPEVIGMINASHPELHSTIIAKAQYSVDATLTASKPELVVGISIRANGDNELDSTLLPRVIRASDLHCTFDALNNQRNGAYYFII